MAEHNPLALVHNLPNPAYKPNIILLPNDILAKVRTLVVGIDMHERLIENDEVRLHEKVTLELDETMVDGVMLLILDDGAKAFATDTLFWNTAVENDWDIDIST